MHKGLFIGAMHRAVEEVMERFPECKLVLGHRAARVAVVDGTRFVGYIDMDTGEVRWAPIEGVHVVHSKP